MEDILSKIKEEKKLFMESIDSILEQYFLTKFKIKQISNKGIPVPDELLQLSDDLKQQILNKI